MTANRDLAARLRAEADDAVHHRKVLLVAAVALSESNSFTAARKILQGWDGPASIRNDAIELLDQLAAELPASPGGETQEGTRP